MNEQELIEKLKAFRGISPDPLFAHALKQTLLQPKVRTGVWLKPQNNLFQGLNFGLAMVLTALFIVVFVGGVNGSLKNKIISSALGVDILNETATTTSKQNIDNRLSEANHISDVAEKTRVALREAAVSGMGHISPTILDQESKSFNFQDPTNKSIDALLNEAI